MTLLLDEFEATVAAAGILCPTCGDEQTEKLDSAEPKLSNVERIIGSSLCWYRCCRGHQFATLEPVF